MISINEIRERVQAPRKSVDSWYGRNVMRRFSAYLTLLAYDAKLTPNQVSAISAIPMLVGTGSAIFEQSVAGWLIGANLWYLIDHVDGELARLKSQSSLTGFYFDTLLNFIVQPLFFIGWGYLLAPTAPIFEQIGWFTAISYGMLSIIPMTQEAIFFATGKQKNLMVTPALNNAVTDSTAKKIFMALHQSVLFPNLLLAATAVGLTGFFNHDLMLSFLSLQLVACTVTSLTVWVAQLIHIVIKKKLDSH